MLIASDNLTQAELSHEVEMMEDPFSYMYRRFQPGNTMTSLSVEMPTFIMILAPDYPTALQRLFAQWKPGQPKQISEPQRALPESVVSPTATTE